MRRALLDINVLIALLDSDHADHTRATEWLRANLNEGWASCAISENGFVRTISQPRYPSPVSPAEAISLLNHACGTEIHQFWPCDVSVLDRSIVDCSRLHGAKQVTDTYLLALAVHHDGVFVTFDRAISMAVVPGARPHHLVIL